MEFSGSLRGISDLDRAFLNLPRATQRRAIIPSLRAGAYVVRDLAVSNLKAVTSGESTGIGEKNIRIYTLKKYKGYYRVSVQVKKGAVNERKIVRGQPVRVGLYLAVLEYGKEGQPPRSWIRKAIREGESSSVSKLTTEMNKRMVDAVREARR